MAARSSRDRELIALAEALPTSPLLAGLDPDQRARLASQGREITLAAGEWLLRQGQEADSMYVIRSGRLEVLYEGPPETVVRIMRRGDVVGELALLHPGRRTASVRARRESVLLELSRTQFEDLVYSEPTFALALARSVGAQLALSPPAVAPAHPPRLIAVIRLDRGAPGPEAVDELARELDAAGRLIRLDPQSGREEADLLAAIDCAEQDGERVLLVAGDTDDAETWTELCLREADAVLALSAGTPDPRWTARATALNGCELLCAGASPPDHVLAALEPRELQVVAGPASLRQALGSTARRLSGRATGVVFSGGGLRAAAHLGVIEELRAAGIRIDRLAGVSSGAVVAAAIAAGWEVEELYELLLQTFNKGKPARDYAIPAYALLRGDRARQVIESLVGTVRIEELATRFFCLSSDLAARESVVHRRGSLAEAVYASLAIPGLLPPVATDDGRLLVDGGVLDNLPVATMARTAEGPVIASDVTSQQDSLRPQASQGRVRSNLRRALTGSDGTLPKLSDTIVRTVLVGSADTVAAARRYADFVITPEVSGVGLLDWRRFAAMRESGRVAARRALEENGALPWS